MTQTKRIPKKTQVLKYLKKGGKISNAIAVQKFDAYRLSAIIFDLKNNEGYNIDGDYFKVKKDKPKVYFYFLVK